MSNQTEGRPDLADLAENIRAELRAATRIPAPRWPKPTGRVLRTPGSLPQDLIKSAMRA